MCHRFLLAVWFPIVAVRPRFVIGAQISCENLEDKDARLAWEDLRYLVEGKVSLIGLPEASRAGKFAAWWISISERVDNNVLSPGLGPKAECVIGRWTSFMLLTEVLLNRETTIPKGNRDCSSNAAAQLLRRHLAIGLKHDAGVLEDLPPPLRLLASGQLGTRQGGSPAEAEEEGRPVTLRDVAGSSWYTFFALVPRLRRSVLRLLEHLGVRAQGEGLGQLFNLLVVLVPEAAGKERLFMGLPSGDLMAVAQEMLALSANATAAGPPVAEAMGLVARLEAALEGWSRGLWSAGVGGLGTILALLFLDAQWSLFTSLHRLLLPGAVLLRFPEATHSRFGLADPRRPRRVEDSRWTSASCSGPKQGGLHGPAESWGSGWRSAWADEEVPVLRHRRATVRWRCAVAVRLFREPHITSASTLSRKSLQCSPTVVDVLQHYGRMARRLCARRGGQCPTLRYVDTGASLGDCALAAVGLLPEAALKALAFDADERVHELLKETLELNRLVPVQKQGTAVEARLVMLDERRQPPRQMPLFWGGVSTGYAGGQPARLRSLSRRPVRVSTLDRELSRPWAGHRGADFVSVFTHGDEGVLRGAAALIRARSVTCWAVRCPEPARGSASPFLAGAEQIFREAGYLTAFVGSWVLATPEEAARRGGGGGSGAAFCPAPAHWNSSRAG